MKRTTLIPLIVACSLFMENMDSTILATSLPQIAADLGENPLALKLALTSYLVSLAVFIPVSGWVADRYGSRTVFAWAIGVFVCGSLLSGASSSLEGFVGARFLQGMGGAMMVPVGRLVLIRAVAKNELVAALNLLTIPALMGPLLGPPIGGLITQYAHWRWIFFINVPTGILGLWLVLKYIPNVREENNPPLDVAGFLLSGIGLSVLMLGLSTLGGHLMPKSASFACMGLGAAVLALYVRHALRRERPALLDLRLLARTSFFNGVAVGNMFRMSAGSLPFLLPLMLQIGFGMSPFHAGLVVAVSTVGVLMMKPITIGALRRWGFQRAMTVNCVLFSAMVALCATFDASTPYWLMGGILFISGCARSLQFTSLHSLSFGELQPEEMSRATSFAAMAQRLSQSIGIAIAAYVLEIVSTLHGHETLQANDFWPAFLVMSAFALAPVFWHARMPRDIGSELSGYRGTAPRGSGKGGV